MLDNTMPAAQAPAVPLSERYKHDTAEPEWRERPTTAERPGHSTSVPQARLRPVASTQR